LVGTDNTGDAATAFRVPDIIAKDLTRHIEAQIIFGDLAPNPRLVAEEIVQKYNVSRSPVREALRLLEQEGLALRQSRRGVWVSPLGLDDLDEVYSCRVVLEGLAVELAAKNHIDSDMTAIRQAFAAFEATLASDDVRAFFQHNLALAATIYAAARNRTLKRLLGSVGKQSLRYRYFAYAHAPEMKTVSVEGHRAILNAIEKRNARHARSLMEDLIQQSWSAIRQHFPDNPGAAGA